MKRANSTLMGLLAGVMIAGSAHADVCEFFNETVSSAPTQSDTFLERVFETKDSKKVSARVIVGLAQRADKGSSGASDDVAQVLCNAGGEVVVGVTHYVFKDGVKLATGGNETASKVVDAAEHTTRGIVLRFLNKDEKALEPREVAADVLTDAVMAGVDYGVEAAVEATGADSYLPKEDEDGYTFVAVSKEVLRAALASLVRGTLDQQVGDRVFGQRS